MKQINSNKYEITPNYNDLLVILIQDLDNLEEKTVILIHQLERVLKQKKVELDNDIMRHLYFIYQHQILMYLLHALFVWPSAIKDSGILSTMYLTLFRKLRDILAKLEVKISSQPKIDMRISVINNLFNLTPDTLNEIVEGAKKSDIDLEVEKILDIIWKNSKIFYKDLKYKFDTSSQLEGTPKDWKTLIK